MLSKITFSKLTLCAVAALGTLTMTAVLPASAQVPPPGFGGRPYGFGGPHGERHPEIYHALRTLQQTERDLRHANDDFGGHKLKAAELCLQAENQLRLALRYDRG